jgi:hypothetical protein
MRISLATAAVLIATTVPAWTQTATRCQGGSDTAGGCPPPMTNSELDAARRLDSNATSAIEVPAIQRSRTNASGPNSSGGGFVDNPTSEFNSLQREDQAEESSIGGTGGTDSKARGAGGIDTSSGGASIGSPSSPSIR